MCTFPNRLKNPSKHFDLSKDRPYITCGCGKCIDCMNAKRSDWQIRLYYDWLQAQAHGGYSLIATLTYDDEHLPIKYLPYKDHYVAFPCFDSHDVPTMTHNIRRKYKDFHYFAQEEYGDCGRPYITDSGRLAYTTHRPHYHLYCSAWSIPFEELKALIEEEWIYGNVYWSKRKDSPMPPGVIDGNGAIGYATKYVCKDMSTDKSLQLALSLLPEDISNEDKRCFIPKHYQSQKLGLYVKDVTDPKLLAQGLCEVPDLKAGKKIVKLPLYVERKLFYSTNNPTHTYIPTAEGREVLAMRMNNIRLTSIENLHAIVSNPREHISDELLYEINDILGTKFDSPEAYINRFIELKGKFSITQLVDYGILFKDQIVETNKNGHYIYLGDISSYLDYDISIEEFKYIYADKLDKDRKEFEPKEDKKVFDSLDRLRVQNINPYYRQMDAALSFINSYSQACSIIGWHETIARRDEYKRQATYFKHSHYDYKSKKPRSA